MVISSNGSNATKVYTNKVATANESNAKRTNTNMATTANEPVKRRADDNSKRVDANVAVTASKPTKKRADAKIVVRASKTTNTNINKSANNAKKAYANVVTTNVMAATNKVTSKVKKHRCQRNGREESRCQQTGKEMHIHIPTTADANIISEKRADATNQLLIRNLK